MHDGEEGYARHMLPYLELICYPPNHTPSEHSAHRSQTLVIVTSLANLYSSIMIFNQLFLVPAIALSAAAQSQ